MKLSDALTADRIQLRLSSTDKTAAIEEMIALMTSSRGFADPEAILGVVLDREAIQSTGLGRGIAIPHGQSDDITGVVAALGISRAGLDFEAVDELPVNLVFLILSSSTAVPAYLSVISRTARIFGKEEMRQKVVAAASAEEIIDLIRQQEEM